MAMDVGGAKGGLRADINVTPLADVMLVLLIIMMLIAPMLQKGVDVRLPEAANTVDKPDTQEQTVIAITAGLAPILWSQGTGADVMKRIAAPMVGGMVTSTVLTLVVIPAIYLLWRGWELRRSPGP